MTSRRSDYAVSLVYSYSHKDSSHRMEMEKALAQLKRDGVLTDWSDQSILSGQSISNSIQRKLESADVIAFLMSPDFIASEECMKEWERAQRLAAENPMLVRVPIILRSCAWQDLPDAHDLKALPTDATPVTLHDDSDSAWLDVSSGVKAVVEQLRSTFSPKPEFLSSMEQTEFLSQKSINLSDLFVFLPLIRHNPQDGIGNHLQERIIEPDELLRIPFSIIHGKDRSGKTALARFLLLKLTSQDEPVLYVDLKEVPQRPGNRFLRTTFEEQFHGDYDLWMQRSHKTLILDDLSGRANLITFVESVQEYFERIVITTSSEVYYAFYRDEFRLADFDELEITELTHDLQEQLIRKRLALRNQVADLDDGQVDQAEDKVNSIVINNRVVPRYPFFVLCILQTFEAYMPSGFSITSYGHCYYALIVASLIRAGVSREDSEINACFNFTEHLAFALYKHRSEQSSEPFDFPQFVQNYRDAFVISNAVINRLKHVDFGLIDQSGHFRSTYMHYFFLGKHLSTGTAENRILIQEMCESTHLPSSFLTLLFTIHHTNSMEIIDEILLRTICALDQVSPATLVGTETSRFGEIVTALPRTILSSRSVQDERRRDRERQTAASAHSTEAEEAAESNGTYMHEAVNDIYRVLKNNEIMGQVLRNKYGSIRKDKIEEVIEIVADAGLRLVNFILKDEGEIMEMAHFIKTRNPKYDLARIRKDLRMFSFLWTIVNVEHVVRAINTPEMRPSIDMVVSRMDTPAYEIIRYFAMLDTSMAFEDGEKGALQELLRKHKDPFVKSVISLRTQHYLNTHRTRASMEQSICSLLSVKYVPRAIRGGS